MSFKTASAILRGGWLIQESYVQTNYDLILKVRAGEPVNFGLSEREEEELKGVLYATGISLASSTAYYQVGMYSRFDEVQPGSVAVVNLLGPVLKYGDMCSYGMVDKASLLQRIAASGKFKSIILNVDSPGGQADGTQLLADTIIQIRSLYGIKVIAMVDDGMMASAAMWIGSACDEIYATKLTDTFGSIGVYMTLMDFSKYLEENGIKMIDVYADPSTDKNKAYKDALKGNLDLLKADLNFLAETFIASVKTNRGDRLKAGDENPFTGKMYSAQKATDIGLIDGILPFDEILQRAADHGSDTSANNPTTHKNMFGNKFSALSALVGVAAASITATQVEAVNQQIAGQKIEGVTLALDSELETASAAAGANAAALTAINAALGEGNHKATLSEAVAALVTAKSASDKSATDAAAESDKYKKLATEYGAQLSEDPTTGTKNGAEQIAETTDDANLSFLSEADVELAQMRAGMTKLPA